MRFGLQPGMQPAAYKKMIQVERQKNERNERERGRRGSGNEMKYDEMKHSFSFKSNVKEKFVSKGTLYVHFSWKLDTWLVMTRAMGWTLLTFQTEMEVDQNTLRWNKKTIVPMYYDSN